MNAKAADWFHNAVVAGLQLLYTLNLQDRPAAEVLPLTAVTWVEVLWRSRETWDEAHDARRLPAAFKSLAAVAERWPSPRHLAVHLPPRITVAALPPPAAPPQPPAARAQLLKLRAEICARGGRSVGGLAAPLVRGTFAAAQQADEELSGVRSGDEGLS